MENFVVPKQESLQIYQKEQMSVKEKLKILSDAAKYDVACTSSGSSRRGKKGHLGNTVSAGICHTFSSDGRCVSLLKILFSNDCVFDCKYCPSRAANEKERATFTPEEICRLVVEFYRRNYIEGLFLSSAVVKSPAYTMERMYEAIYMLRNKYHFNGYIHVKAIPGAPDDIIYALGFLVDRMSVNLELPTAEGLKTGIQKMKEIRKEFETNLFIPGDKEGMNVELDKAIRLYDFIIMGELVAYDALNRDESCGGHFREEYQTEEGEAKRDDENFFYVACWEYQGSDEKAPVLLKEPLVYEAIKVQTRNYKS